MDRSSSVPLLLHRIALLGGTAAACLQMSCTLSQPTAPPPAAPAPPVVDRTIGDEVYRRAASQRAERLEREIARLRGDLRQAEEALVAAESGMRAVHSRADAVSSLASARIQIERSQQGAPWRETEFSEAEAKLAEADRLINEGHFGAALYFVYRASRIADELEAEAEAVRSTPGTRFVRGRRVNLRSGPSTSETVLAVLTQGTPVFPERKAEQWILVRTASGPVGWVHGSLLRKP